MRRRRGGGARRGPSETKANTSHATPTATMTAYSNVPQPRGVINQRPDDGERECLRGERNDQRSNDASDDAR